MSKFKENVLKAIRMVPAGKVASYGQIALLAGVPRGARQVGMILNRMEDENEAEDMLPWWRIVNNSGRITIKGSEFSPEDQRRRLIKEGVKVDKDLTLDIKKYRFIPSGNEMQDLRLKDEELEKLLSLI